jgi:hypothetical protein
MKLPSEVIAGASKAVGNMETYAMDPTKPKIYLPGEPIPFGARLPLSKEWRTDAPSLDPAYVPQAQTRPAATASPLRQRPQFSDFEAGTDAELKALAELRNVCFAACLLADSVGLLRFGVWQNKRAWIVTDDERCNAQARRLDGAPWPCGKPQTLPGSWASWPLGIKTGANYPAFLLCMGAPDLLAALHFIHVEAAECFHFPVAILDARQHIHEDALPLFAGKRVRLFPHLDSAGQDAAERWAAQLATVGADVDCADFTGLRKADGSPVKDLNDCTSIHPDDAKELEGLLPE